MKNILTITASAALIFLSNDTQAQQTAAGQYQQQAPKVQAQATTTAATENTDKPTTKPIALNNAMCPVSNEPIGEDGGKKVVHKGYEISLCCGGCVKDFKKNPDAYLKSVLEAGKAKPSQSKDETSAVKPVNNANCPVSGHPVGSMQKGSNVVYNGYQVGLCCDGCIGKFNQNADAYLKAMLDAQK